MSVEQQRNEIAEIITKVPTESARERLTGELNILVSRYDAPAATVEEKKDVEARLAQLRRDAEIAAQVSLWSTFSMVLVGVVLLAFFGGIFLYLRGMLPEPYWTIEATRPIIVFTLIVAMLGFGGLLIVRALFSNDDKETLQTRFRLAREVFLVFASVFSTVIGFYFGSATPSTPADPPVLSAPVLGADGMVTVSVTNGRFPYSGTITIAGGDTLTLAPTAERSQLSIQLSKQVDCPAGATVRVADGDGRSVERTIDQTAERLRGLGWVGCAEPIQDAGNNVADNSVTNKSD